MKIFKFIVLVTLLGSFVACDKVLEELANDNTVLLTKKVWTFKSISGYSDLGNQVAATLFTGATYQFRPDGTYTALVLAQPNDGTWEFNADKTVITLELGTADALDWNVVELTETELKVNYANEDALAGILTLTFN